MLKIFKYLKPIEWLMVCISLIFIVSSVWLELRLPDYMSEITRIVSSGDILQPSSSDIADIWRNGGYMLLCAAGSLCVTIIVGFFAARIGASFSRNLRSLLFNKVESFSMEEINRYSTSSLITRSTNDVTQVQMLIVMGMMVIFRAPIMAIWAITKVAGKGFELSMVTASAVAIMLVIVTIMMIFVVPKFRKMQSLIDNVTRVTRENLTGVRVVRAYNAESHQEGIFEKANLELTATQLFTTRAMAIAMPVMQLMMGGMGLAIYWVGAYLIDAADVMGRIGIFSNMVVFMQYSMMVVMSFMMLVMIFIMLSRASVAAKRINEVLDTTPAIIGGTITDIHPEQDKHCGQSELQRYGEVEFRNVSFKYPDADEDADYALQNVSFKADRGETVAFIGSTGSGKTTLAKLVMRFFDVTEGEVLVDGINVKEYALETLYRKIGYVPQKAVLFKGTIASNVAYGNDFEEPFNYKQYRQAAAAIDIAQGSDFVCEMEGSLDAQIAQDGTNLSGGQKQRLAIARAICHKPEIYIFDDSFSALDYKTDRVLRNCLKEETAGVTTLIIAQRIGTIMDADKIIVLDEGNVVGMGTHRELFINCEVYKEIAKSQLSEEELALYKAEQLRFSQLSEEEGTGGQV